jgi:PadR family transcriptional regulator AphA
LSTDALNPVSYVVLALVGEGGASATDIARMVGQGRELYYAAAPSQLYREPKRLAKLGYLRARVVPGRTRPRTLYRLTPAGHRALRTWLAGPSSFPRVQNEAHLRLLAGDLVDDAAIVASFTAMLPQLDELDARLDEMEAQLGGVPHRARYLRLNHAYARRLVALHREWVAAIERELTS